MYKTCHAKPLQKCAIPVPQHCMCVTCFFDQHGDGCCCTEPSENLRVRIWEKNMHVVTPRCAAAAVVSAVVLRRPTKEYTHPYSMMHRRLPTAGIEVAPHYHQLLVHQCQLRRAKQSLHFASIPTNFSIFINLVLQLHQQQQLLSINIISSTKIITTYKYNTLNCEHYLST